MTHQRQDGIACDVHGETDEAPTDNTRKSRSARTPFHLTLDSLSKSPVQNLEAKGEALLATYDAASTSVLLASRKVDEQTLTFTRESGGRLRDAQTGSFWNPVTLEAESGKLKGKRLTRKVGQMAYLESWSTFYPTSQSLRELLR